MTAFGFQTTGEEGFNSIQPTGTFNLSSVHTHYILTLQPIIGRVGRPEDIAGLALFLAAPASAHVTGTHTLIDGGSRYRAHAVVASTKL